MRGQLLDRAVFLGAMLVTAALTTVLIVVVVGQAPGRGRLVVRPAATASTAAPRR